MKNESEIGGWITIHAGGSGGFWDGNRILRATLKQTRSAVERLLREHKTPLDMERGSFDLDGKKIMLGGVAGPHRIFWRRATREELDGFDYDTWLIEEFPRDKS